MSHTPAPFRCVSFSPDKGAGRTGAPALGRRAVLMLGVSFALGSSLLWRRANGSAQKSTLTAVFLGQSEIHYLFARGGFWNNIGVVPLPSEPNLTVYHYSTSGLPDGVPVTTASVTAGDVSQSMGVLSAFLAHAAPGVQFVVGSAAQSGTSRRALGTDDDDGREWQPTADAIAALERDYGKVDTMIECWFNADHARITNFRNNFWPLYFGVNGDGSPFMLGDDAPYGNAVDHCFWDALAPVDEKGRGILARSETNWRILTPMPFWNLPESPNPEQVNFSINDGRLSEPARQRLLELVPNEIAQSVSLEVGPSAHMCWFPTGNSIHPNTQDPDGQILFMWPFALAMLREAGISAGEPTIVGVEGPETGEYVDVLVDLPNGGTLTTLRQFRDDPFPAERSPHQQAVTGFEVQRDGTRRPVFRESETSYPADTRGTVEIIDSGSGSPRRGRVRITPTEVFRLSDSISYLRGQATAGLLEPRDRDNRLYTDMLMEHVPGFYDPTARANGGVPFEGIPVRPLQEEIVTPSTVVSGEILDIFEDYSTFADGLLSAQEGWAALTGPSLEIVDGFLQRRAENGIGASSAMGRTEDWPPDQEVTITAQNSNALNTNSQVIIRLRRSGSNDHYRYSLRRTGEWRLDRIVGGNDTTLASGSVTNSGTMTLRARAIGDRITAWINGNEVADVTDTGTTVTTGKPGLAIVIAGNGNTHAAEAPISRILTFAASNAS
ncbi:MAG: hypothetical protein ACXIUW_07170 [Roseinatronobacter sp.]